MTDHTDDLHVAFEAVHSAARLALGHYAAGVRPTLKADGSPMTAADRAVERMLRDELSTARPGDAFLGEELGRVGDGERVWILDPIDGTTFFVRRTPHWRIQIALEVRGVVEIAVVASPALRHCWWATRGGAFESSWPRTHHDTRRLQVSSTSILDDAVLDAVDDDARSRLPAGRTTPATTPLPLVELVAGDLDGFLVERYHKWDHAPWILIVEEAGGRFTDRTGGRADDRGGGPYSNAALHDALLARLDYPKRDRPRR